MYIQCMKCTNASFYLAQHNTYTRHTKTDMCRSNYPGMLVTACIEVLYSSQKSAHTSISPIVPTTAIYCTYQTWKLVELKCVFFSCWFTIHCYRDIDISLRYIFELYRFICILHIFIERY